MSQNIVQQLIKAKVKRSIKDSLIFASPKIKVKINQGVVKGVREKLTDGRSFYRFSGIPYGKNPIGNLRFKNPEKLLKFDTDVLDCTRERSACFQKSIVTSKYLGSEFCLHLNVYAPADAQYRKLPVMVFIHGGAFMFDSNSVDFYSPEYLLMEDVIVVTVNYRLQTLGFLSLPSMGISGNAGLKDQQMALEWVYENISYFNGDPENICLFGESAGASSVYLHILNEKSRKLISSAICNSGTALDPWLYQRNGEQKTRKLAERAGAKGTSDRDIYEALMNAPTKFLYDNHLKVREPDELRRSIPPTFKPIIEKEGEGTFMTKPPVELYKTQANQIKFPILVGNNSADGSVTTNYFRHCHDSFNEDSVRFVPFFVDIDPLSREAKELGEKIRHYYMGDDKVSQESIQKFLNLNSDTYFFVPTMISNRFMQIYQPAVKQYIYEFDFDGKLNFLKRALKMNAFKGACHFDDMAYLFRHQILDVTVGKNSREYKMRERMCKLWTNFAKYKNPTPHNNNPLNVTWDPVKSTDKDLKYMILDDNPRMEKNLRASRMEFWRDILEEYNGSFLNPKCP